MREAAVTMAATLGSFATALAISHAASLSTSVIVLAVAVALTMGRHGQRAAHRTAPARILRVLVVPLFAVGANEIGMQIFQHPDLGDALFVVSVSATIWARRLGPLTRQAVTLATFPLIAMLIVPAPVVDINGSGADTRWWSALDRPRGAGVGRRHASPGPACRPARRRAWTAGAHARSRTIGEQRRAHATERVTDDASDGISRELGQRQADGRQRQDGDPMAVALAGAFAVGRGLFGSHWTWVVLTAFIVCSGNRGRGDVVYKAAMRLVGACTGTLAATLLTGLFAPRR